MRFQLHREDRMTNNDDLLIARQGACLLLTFNRPTSRNALTFDMYRRLAEAIKRIPDDPSIRVVLISGAGGKAFAAGTDISEFKAFSSPADATAYERSISDILGVLAHCPVPTLAAIAGACTGGGFGIASCCDLRLATVDARFGVPIARTLGNCLSLSSHARISALIGPARLADMIITARLFDAEEMRAAGLLTEILPDYESLQTRALALAHTIAGHAPITMQVTRESLRALQVAVDPAVERALFQRAYQSEDFAEGVRAFLEKRKPEWTGR
jgi:enoyl-CoA hydratase